MTTFASPNAAKLCLSAALIGLLAVMGGCAKTKTAKTAVPPPAALPADTSIVTGSVSAPSRQNPSAPAQNNPGTVTGVKTAALSNAQTAVATRTTENRISLAFPKKGYALSGAQSEQLAGFVRDAKKRNKRVKVIGIATPKRGKKSKAAKQEAREEASRRAKATSLFLRVYGLETKDMTITTKDQKPRKGLSRRRVELVLQ